MGYSAEIDQGALKEMSDYLFGVAEKTGRQAGAPPEYDISYYDHQLPGGMTSTLRRQLAERKMEQSTFEGRWIGKIDLDEEESRSNTSDIKKKYNIKGETFAISGSGKFLALKEILTDVFNIEGEYILEFNYENRITYYSVPDEENKYMVGRDYPGAWSGSLSASISIIITE